MDAGEQLAGHLRDYAGEAPIVLGIPRGGVPVAARVARHLGAPLDVCVVRRLHAAGPLKLGIGAVAEGGAVFLDRRMLHLTGPRNAEVAQQIRRERAKVEDLAERFRDGQPPPVLQDRTVILVDDGIALGETVQAALRCLRRQQPRRIVLAVPVAASESLEPLEPRVDALVCLHRDPALCSLGQWFEDFAPISDGEVLGLLGAHRAPRREARLQLLA
ncbi:MAG: phosphoribosyltransferase family protein [Polyangia bacterium]